MEINWMLILSQVLQTVLIVILPPLAVAAVKFIKAKVAEIYAHIEMNNPDFADMLMTAANVAVKAAQQAFESDQGEEKLVYAIDMVENFLSFKGITIDVDIIAQAVETAVFNLKQNYDI